MQHAVLGGRPVQAYRKWLHRIPEVYRAEALDEAKPGSVAPLTSIKAADGALGGHIHAVRIAS